MKSGHRSTWHDRRVMEAGFGRPSRRAAMRGLLAGALGTGLAGCSVRLEQDAPDLRVLKTQGPPPDHDVLMATWRSVQVLVRSANGIADSAHPWVARVRAAHQEQASRLVDVMAATGISLPSASSPTSAPAAPTKSSAAVARLAASEGSFPASATERDLWSASSDNRAMLVAIGIQRRCARSLLGGPPLPPVGTVPTREIALPIGRAVRPAVYGFEQIAGTTPLRARKQVSATLTWLTGARDQLGPVVSGPQAPSYDLPGRTDTEADRATLAQALLSDVVTAVAAQTERLGGESWDAQQWAHRLWSLSATDHARWGGGLPAFPGLR